jgi:DNA-binding protein YbaB
MTEPGLTPEERAARVSELQVEADEAMAGLRTRMAAVAQAQQTALSGTGEATSRDGSVRVTVDATGVVTQLAFSDTAFQKSTPERLAVATVATIQEAAAQARARMQQTLAPLTAESQPALAVARRNVPGLAELTVPEVPRTATDPGELDDQEPQVGYAFDKQIEPEEEPAAQVPPSQVKRPRPIEPDEDEYDDGSIYR